MHQTDVTFTLLLKKRTNLQYSNEEAVSRYSLEGAQLLLIVIKNFPLGIVLPNSLSTGEKIAQT